MTAPEILQALMSTATPVLPGAALLRFALPVMWALVLAGCMVTLGAKWPRRRQLGCVALLVVWALIPGSLSITYWLALAFQMPSLVTGLVCLGWLVAGLTRWRPLDAFQSGLDRVDWLDRIGLIGIALGWLLLLDTLAIWPWSLYSLGFGAASLMLVCVGAALLWAAKGHSVGLALTALALVLFVVTRLPTGNLWDALMDPWLWVVLQVLWLRKFIRKVL